MSEPAFDDMLDEEVTTSDSQSAALIDSLADARVKAAYWQGRCEGFEAVIANMVAAHGQTLEAVQWSNNQTVDYLGYLKDRLNSLEAKPR